jgi:hypothetical protein
MPRRKKAPEGFRGAYLSQDEDSTPKAQAVLYVGGDLDQVGWVIDTRGDMLTVTLSDGKTITRHKRNFEAK